ncbi:putative transposable element [Pseudoloma neurophilia]|uniref:Putative transposable element n=1 Tax=Pseudoloma neurophilia TaxID=146866 RepID=A0A0R0LVE4_9MICR|nr:putative transposable element [Pseudoloma neurophilia]
MDMGSRLSMTEVLNWADSRVILDILERKWFGIYPLPSKILSDNAKVFTSKIFKNLLSFYQIKQHLCIPFNPRGNSILERSHATILDSLRCLGQTSMRIATKIIDNAHNATFSTALGISPIQKHSDVANSHQLRLKTSNSWLGRLKPSSKKNNLKYLQSVNKTRIPFDFTNQQVFLERKQNSKLDPTYDGPYKVFQDCPKHNFVKIKFGNKIHCFPYRDIQPYKGKESVVLDTQ